MPCPFCEIDPTRTVVLEEKDHCRVVFSDPRLVPGHLLVIPKRHVELPAELNDEERREIFDTILDYQTKIMSRMSSGCDVRQNCRPFLPESRIKVDHVHYHLLPRELGDAIYEKTKGQSELFQSLTAEELKSVIEHLS
jgi:histidine triad (HIT) family protein